MSKRGDEEQLLSRFPTLETNTFKAEFTFTETEHQFNLPTTGISKNNTPGFIGGANRFVGQEIPRLTTLAGTSFSWRSS